MSERHRFTGTIAGIGTSSGTRLVVGVWHTSPMGSFADVMVEDAGGRRTLLAPSDAVATFVSGTYSFDEVLVVDVLVRRGAAWRVHAGPLDATFVPGRRHRLAHLLRLVPPGLARTATWARLCDPVARRAMPGVRTYGSAGSGRTEWYAARDVRLIDAASATWDGADLGGLAPVEPPVRFGFGSAPRIPVVTELSSYVRLP